MSASASESFTLAGCLLDPVAFRREPERTESKQFSIRQVRARIKDLFRPSAFIYWADFLFHVTLGYASASIYFVAPLFSWQQILAYLIAGFSLFRVGSFIHEIVHMSGRHLLGFRIAWNAIAGVPMLMPSFFYRNHVDHHSQKHYGTGLDGEYLPLGSGLLREVAYFFAQIVLLPAFVFLRFFLITPISFLHPKLRRWTLERASFFVINFGYRQPIPPNAPLKLWAAIEIFCCLRAWAIPMAVIFGLSTWERIPMLYALALMTLGLNYIRNLVAHRYASEGTPMSHVAQLADSVNIEGMPVVTELFFPLYLRYHGLHHLFPNLPYHNLHKRHQRLMAELPADSLYRQTVYPGFWNVTKQLVSNALQARRKKRIGQPIGSDIWYEQRRGILSGAGTSSIGSQSRSPKDAETSMA